MIKHLEDIGYTVVFSPNENSPEHVLDFKIYEIVGGVEVDNNLYWMDEWLQPTPDFEKAELYIYGHLKWDGCMNWAANESGVMFHFCGVDDAKNLFKLFNEIYKLADELIPAWDG